MGERAHQAQRVDLSLQMTARGYLLSSPGLPGWSRHVTSPTELTRAVRSAFTEAEIAAYARFRGTEYDCSPLAGCAFDRRLESVPAPPPPERRHPSEPPPETQVPRASYRADAVHRPDCHDPAAWMPLPDGRWRSPGGLRFQPDAAVVASVVERRSLLGLPTTA